MDPQNQDDENEDYDVFAKYRPTPLTEDIVPIFSESSSEGYDPLERYRYSEEEVKKVKEETHKKKQNAYNPDELAKEARNQFAKETLIGVGGTYGDLAEMIGLNSRDPDVTYTAKKEKNLNEHEILSKFREPGYKPSIEELTALQSNDDFPGFQLPTSKHLRAINEAVGGPGEPETPSGRYSARSGRLYGGGLAFGQANPLPALGAAVVGQGLEEVNAPELVQTAGEIVTILLSQGKGVPANTAKKELKPLVQSLKDFGYTDEQITIAINSAYKGGNKAKIATKGSATEKAFEDFATKSDDLVTEILENQIPGLDKGIKNVHELASTAYGKVVQDASKLNIKNLDNFFDSMHSTMGDIRKTVGNNPSAKEFMTELTEDTLDIISSPTADNMISFYKKLNRLGKWVGRDQKDRILTNVKNSIKDTFKAEGKAGQVIAEDFEKVNKGIRKAYQAEEAVDLLNKAKTADGYDYKKLDKIFDKQDNIELLTEVLGKQQTKNLQLISNTGKKVGDFDKAWKATNGTKLGLAADLVRGGLGTYYLLQGDFEHLGYVLASKAGTYGIRRLAEQSLKDPKLQNIIIRGLHAVQTNSPKSLALVNASLQRYLDENDYDFELNPSKPKKNSTNK